MLSKNGVESNPHLILSRQILLSYFSNPELLINYFNSQIEIANLDFEINNLDKNFYLIFKYKKVILEFK
jgi:hypothetical protein